VKIKIVLVPVMGMSLLAAELPYIGVVNAEGSFWADSAGVSNHATLFNGSTIQTEAVPASVQLKGGARLVLDAQSSARIYADHTLLEKGRAQLDAGETYDIEARSLRVFLAAPGSRVIVTVRGAMIDVGALSGQIRVTNGGGVLVAMVDPGKQFELRPQAAPGAAVIAGVAVTVVAGVVAGIVVAQQQKSPISQGR